MRNIIFVLMLFVMAITVWPLEASLNEKISAEYESNWESLKQYECPDWFRDAKFGIYFHWGPYSVPAYKSEWYSRWMYSKDNPIRKHHVKTYGSLDKFGYKDFIPMFKAEKFDADRWADLFVKAGAKFAGPVAEHADGFAMWDSDLTQWCAAKMGPKRDIVGELEKAIRKRDMKFIATLHHQWLYKWYPTMNENTDAGNPVYEDLYGPKISSGKYPDDKFCQRWYDRSVEVVDKYKPDLVWFDNKLDTINEEYRIAFLRHYYNSAIDWGREVVTTYKFKDLPKGTAVLDLERSRMKDVRAFPWLTDDSICWNSWCHIRQPKYKSTDRLIDTLVDIVSKNGCLLLNITPKANGEIPQPVQRRLLEMGKWLELNGEAIYGTRPWEIYGEGPTKVVEGHLSEKKNKDATAKDIRFTTKGNVLYAVLLGWPDDGICNIKSLSTQGIFKKKIQSVHLLGYQGKIEWSRDNKGLTVSTPAVKPCEHAFVLMIQSEE